MISYFHRRKGKLSSCEDSLTAVVFDTLKYLPIELFWSILKQSLLNPKLPHSSGELLQISFWDKWDATDTTNSNFVEPDVFLRFNDFDVIIEAKRYDANQQSNTQRDNEIKGYQTEFSKDEKDLYFIQLGGLNHKNDEKDISSTINNKKIVICKTNWTKLLEQIVAKNNDLKESTLSTELAYSRILEDTINGFALHQYYKNRWLKNLKVKESIQIQSLQNLFSYATKR